MNQKKYLYWDEIVTAEGHEIFYEIKLLIIIVKYKLESLTIEILVF